MDTKGSEFASLTDDDVAAVLDRVTNKLAKWRNVFAGWQLGTRAKGDAECQAVRDHREVTMLLRAETNALTALLIKKGIFTAREFSEQLIDEARYLDAQYEQKFPGVRTDDQGIIFTAEAAKAMEHWRP